MLCVGRNLLSYHITIQIFFFLFLNPLKGRPHQTEKILYPSGRVNDAQQPPEKQRH